MKGVIAGIVFFAFGVVAGIVALTTPVYQGTVHYFNIPLYSGGEPFIQVVPFARFCVSEGVGCHSFSDAGLTDSQHDTFVAYSVLLILYVVIAVGGMGAGVLEQCRRASKTPLVILFVVDSLFAFVAWVIMFINRANNPNRDNSYPDRNQLATWASLSIGPSPIIMIVGCIGCAAGVAVAVLVKGSERGDGFTQVSITGTPVQGIRAAAEAVCSSDVAYEVAPALPLRVDDDGRHDDSAPFVAASAAAT